MRSLHAAKEHTYRRQDAPGYYSRHKNGPHIKAWKRAMTHAGRQALKSALRSELAP